MTVNNLTSHQQHTRVYFSNPYLQQPVAFSTIDSLTCEIPSYCGLSLHFHDPYVMQTCFFVFCGKMSLHLLCLHFAEVSKFVSFSLSGQNNEFYYDIFKHTGGMTVLSLDLIGEFHWFVIVLEFYKLIPYHFMEQFITGHNRYMVFKYFPPYEGC